jgi:predicted phosphoribosyltransferase
MPFVDRRSAGRTLASRLARYDGRPHVLVLALPRGGVPVAFEVARALGAPLDVFLVRKLGAPGQEELAIGAIASGGVRVLNDDLVRRLRITPSELADVTAREAADTCDELRRDVDEVICAATPEPFVAVGAWYQDFGQTSDDEVRSLLAEAAEAPLHRTGAVTAPQA